jgi:Asp/Glu/hydantoin racemase
VSLTGVVRPEHQVVKGGRNIYGVPVGLLMLESRFPRIPGDAGNAATWPYPVLYRVVRGASPERVVRRLESDDLLEPFATAAEELERTGVDLVTTNCGFLVLFQAEIQARLGVPFVSSSLLQVPWLGRTLRPGRRIGILTIERTSLTERHLRAAGIGPDIPIGVVGMEEAGGYFTRTIIEDAPELDVDRCREEHRVATRLLLERHPDVGAIVLECTNMPPYADVIREISGLPVFDLVTAVGWMTSSVHRRPFARKGPASR